MTREEKRINQILDRLITSLFYKQNKAYIEEVISEAIGKLFDRIEEETLGLSTDENIELAHNLIRRFLNNEREELPELKKRIKSWEKQIDELVLSNYSASEIKNDLEALSDDMMSINI